MTDRDRDGISRSPTHLLHRAGQCAAEVFQGAMAGTVTPRQLAVLMTVADNEGLSQTGVVDRTGIDRSTLADVVRRLAQRGLVQRRRSRADARAYVLKLTEEGERVLKAAEPVAKRVDGRVLNALPGNRRDEFMTCLRAIVTTLEGMAARA